MQETSLITNGINSVQSSHLLKVPLYIITAFIIYFSEGMVAVLEKIRGYVYYLRRIKSSFFPIWRHFALEGELGYEETQYVVDRIDEISRILFPAGFMFISFIYWSYYLYSE